MSTQTHTGFNCVDSAFRFVLGNDVLCSPEYYDMYLDDIAVWSRNLTQSEVTALYNQADNPVLPSNVPTSGLVAYYPLDGNGNDLSGNNNTLVPNGSLSYTPNYSGKSNSACYFSNGNDYFLTPSSSWSLINNFPQGTVSFWVKINSQYVSNHYFGIGNSFIVKQKHGTGEDLFFGMQDGTTKIRMKLTGSFPAAPGTDIVGNTSLMLNNWYHVVGTWNGVNHTLYINGIQDGQIISSMGMSNRPLPDYFSIGSILYGWNGTPTLPGGAYGSMDDIGIWNRALTQQEITKLYNPCQLSITKQPTNQTIKINTSALFIINASDTSVTYQWQTDFGVGFQSLNSVGQYSGTANDTLIIANTTLSNNNQPFRCIIKSGACSDTSNVAILIISNNVGINDIKNSNVKIYPNPTNNIFNIEGLNKNENNTIQIFDVQGKLVITKTITEKGTIDLSELNKGVYVIKIGEVAQRIMKM
jgi:hypothetical protein